MGGQPCTAGPHRPSSTPLARPCLHPLGRLTHASRPGGRLANARAGVIWRAPSRVPTNQVAMDSLWPEYRGGLTHPASVFLHLGPTWRGKMVRIDPSRYAHLGVGGVLYRLKYGLLVGLSQKREPWVTALRAPRSDCLGPIGYTILDRKPERRKHNEPTCVPLEGYPSSMHPPTL